MKIQNVILTLVAIFIVIACDSDDQVIDKPTKSKLDLLELESGQKAQYVRLDGICGFNEQYNYSTDTLELEVVDVSGNLYFRESFTKGSPLFESQPYSVLYAVEQHEDFVLIPNRSESTLFFFYGNDTIRLNPTPDLELQQAECQNMVGGLPFEGDAIGHLDEWSLHDISLQNQTVVSCVPVIFELEAYLMYNGGTLNMSYTLSSGFPGVSFTGWRLLEE